MIQSPPCSRDASTEIADYLAGRLDQATEEELEQHLLGCGRCGDELETAAAVRAALATGDLVGSRLGRRWVPLAAAAALAGAIGVGLWLQVGRDAGRSGALRGEGDSLAVTAAVAGGSLTVDWHEAPEAERYQVHVLAGDGTLLAQTEVDRPPVTLRLPPEAAPRRVLFVRVEALDPLREPLTTSRPLLLTVERAEPGPR